MALDGESRGRTRVGAGGSLLGIAKLFFLLAAYATTLVLTRLIDPTQLGQYNVVARLIAIPNMVIIQTLLFAVSRPMAAEFEVGTPSYAGLRARGFKLAAVLGGTVCVVFFAGAPFFSEWLLRDPDLLLPIQAVAPISVFYAFYAVNVGTLNATRRFAYQATLDIVMAASKAGLIILGAALSLGLAVTVGGFTVASLLALCLSIVFVIRLRPSLAPASTTAVPMAGFAGALLFFTAATNVLLAMDLLLLKRYASSAAEQDFVGFYSSAQLVALVPYSLLNAVSLVMFPLIAALAATGDAGVIRTYVRETAKVTVLLLALMSAVAASSAHEVQILLFPGAYASAADDLRMLVWGYSGYSLTITSAWILNSTGRSRIALGLVLIVLMTVAVCAWAWVPTLADVGAARAVAVAGAVGTVGALIALDRTFGARLPLFWSLKIAVAVGAVSWLGSTWSATGKIEILAKLMVLTGLFVGLAVGTRAVTKSDLQGLRRAG